MCSTLEIQSNESNDLDLSEDSRTEALDLEAAKTWIYPTNYPIREYQYNIIEKALLNNTLVSLPTGLGKTFIAAVVMYNFFRWYPSGKVIFMAPTRPLVKQQIDACYDIMGIPVDLTAELTGGKLSTSREQIWKDKRVFFITPQILQNDLNNIPWLGNKIKCIVFDEAHKAKRNYAYCEVIRELSSVNKYFRVLALSATPGASIDDCLEIIKNLLISHLEFRTEESVDVKPYIFERNLTTELVPLDEMLLNIKEQYLQVLDVHTRTLVKYKVIQGNYGNLTKGKIFMTLRNFQQKNKSSANYGEIMKNLNICVTLYHAFELLIRHGLRSFLSFFDEHIGKPLLRGNTKILEIMENIRQYLGPPLNLELLPDGSYSEVSKDVKFGHPKFYKLREILLKNFEEKKDSSRVIVFFEYRESVMEAYALLYQHKPLLKPRVFLGQKNGITQKSQLNVVKAFRTGSCNVLLSTCIGEEGIDVGEVDLIICFDISNKSPIRMVQRMGRTGRKKEGSIIVLVTEGKEQQTLKDCLIHKNNVTHHVINSKEIAKGLVKDCPRMLPEGYKPKCEKIYMTVKKMPLKKNSNLKDMFNRISNSHELIFSPDLNLEDIQERLPTTEMLWNKNFLEIGKNPDLLSKKITKQRSFQESHKIGHSEDSKLLVSLLQAADSKRFNIPMSQACSGGSFQAINRNFKQVDIRNMFRSHSSQDFESNLSQGIKLTPPSPTIEKSLGSKALLEEISDFVSINKSKDNERCRHCPDHINCEKIVNVSSNPTSYDWAELDASIFLSVTSADLKLFKEKFSNRKSSEFEFNDSVDFNQIEIPTQETAQEKTVNKSVLTQYLDKSARFEPPKMFDTLLNKYSKSIMETQEIIQQNSSNNFKEVRGNKRPADFETSTISNEVQKIENHLNSEKISKKSYEDNEKKILEFFKLKSILDIFTDKNGSCSQEKIIYSPDIFEGSNKSSSSTDCSPILGSRTNKFHCFEKAKKNFKNKFDSPSKVSEVNSATSSSASLLQQQNITTQEVKSNMLMLDDFCDISLFRIDPVKDITRTDSSETIMLPHLSDSYTVDDFNVNVTKKSISDSSKSTECEDCNKSATSNKLPKSANRNIDTIEYIEDICDLSLLKDIKKFCDQAEKTQLQNTERLKDSYSSTFNESHNEILNKVTSPVLNRLTHKEVFNCNDVSTLVSPDCQSNNSNKENAANDEQKINDIKCQSPILIDSDEFNFCDKNTPKRPKLLKRNFKSSPPVPSTSIRSTVKIQVDSDDDFEPKVVNSPAKLNTFRKKVSNKKVNAVTKNQKKLAAEFIEQEAEVSTGESDDEDDSTQNYYEASFVADETQNLNIEMHARYLQSIRSPVTNRGGFKIPVRQRINNSNIFSQDVEQDETYLEDSFVVNDDIEFCNDLSQLEIMEMELEKRKKKNKMKRKRIINMIDTDNKD